VANPLASLERERLAEPARPVEAPEGLVTPDSILLVARRGDDESPTYKANIERVVKLDMKLAKRHLSQTS
jgi:hypothetical protein